MMPEVTVNFAWGNPRPSVKVTHSRLVWEHSRVPCGAEIEVGDGGQVPPIKRLR